MRQGAVTRDGRGEAVIGMVMMLIGENSRDGGPSGQGAARANRSDAAQGVELEVIYDRAQLIGRTLETVLHNLVEGGCW